MYNEMFETFSVKDKRIITNDWENAMKYLKKYKNLDLVNRIGPIVVGVYLKMGRLSGSYVPEYYVHNLCRESPAVSLTLLIRGGTIHPENHKEKYVQEAKFLEGNAYIPIGGDLSLDDIFAGYEKYFLSPMLDSYVEYEDFALLGGWSRDKNRIEYVLRRVYNELMLWPEDRYFNGMGGFKKWFDGLEERVWKGEELNSIFESELIKHKLEKIPERKIIL